jgi:ABC-2 type transport system permease protein
MPLWLQWVMQISPSTQFVSLSTAILFRDANLQLVWSQVLVLTLIGVAFFSLTLLRFRSSLTS